MLDVRRLRVLREVAARGSFSAAAEALSFTQSAVSQQIAALEREAATRLVERSARGVRMTEAGTALVRHADAIIARLADAEDELRALAGVRGGRLRVSAFPAACATLVPPAVARFRARHPGVELVVEPLEAPDGVRALRAGDVDVAVGIAGGFEPDDPGVEVTGLLEDPLFVLLARNHPLAGRARLRLADLAEEAWMVGTSGACPDAAVFLRACRAAGFEPRIAFTLDDPQAIQGFVAAGLGVSCLPGLALVHVRDDVVVRSLGAHPPVRRVFAGTLAASYRSPAKQAMLDVLVAVAAERAPASAAVRSCRA